MSDAAMDLGTGTLAVLGLTVITVLARGAFVLSRRELPLPDWLERGLCHAPLAALVAVIAPEVLMNQGHLAVLWREPKFYAALAGAAVYLWRRSILATIVVGMAVLSGLRFGLGW